MMRQVLIVILSLPALAAPAFAASELVAKTALATADYKISAELYYDKLTKKPDLWIDFYQGPEETKVQFQATTISDRFGQSQFRLWPEPIVKVDGLSEIIYDAYDLKDGEYNKNRGFALLFHFPIDQLPKQTAALFAKTNPGSIIYDENKNPAFIKAVLTRITGYQVYPVAAFDVELELALSR